MSDWSVALPVHGPPRSCEVCGLHCADDPGARRPYCTPITCPAWHTLARYDHATGRWVELDQDGHDLERNP